MTKTIWIDWENKVMCQNEDELMADFEESDWGTDFTDWLNNNYTTAEIWDMSDDMREQVDKEYAEFRRDELAHYTNIYFQSYEIRV